LNIGKTRFMEISEERIRTWEDAHNRNDVGFLSGCQYQETLDYLHVNLEEGDKVLEIGVGMGYVTKELHDRGFEVSGFDIAQVALDRVKDYCKPYNFNDIGYLPKNYFDIILCNNVVQHVPTPLLKFELREFIRSLKKGGTMSIKSCSAKGYEDTGDNPNRIIRTTKAIKCDESIGIFCRSVEWFTKTIEELGGKLTVVVDIPSYTNEMFSFITGIQVYHITK
jgi:2-polyprenyl-3-methyl-5-hydroxy-6-metoxy-1,4-benzoquinol methylase